MYSNVVILEYLEFFQLTIKPFHLFRKDYPYNNSELKAFNIREENLKRKEDSNLTFQKLTKDITT